MKVATEQAYRAVTARDPRFDGHFVMAVRSTGIYCRPSCPARTPRLINVEFFITTAAAQLHGYRACRRCLPDAVPGSPDWDIRADLAARAMRLINDGVVERVGVAGLARQLGYSERQLTRVLTEQLGAGPLALARAHRAHAARTLIETTDMTFSDIAFAAGFASLRQFNDTIREVFAATPTALRGRAPKICGQPGGIRLRLPFRLPMDVHGVFAFLADRAIPGIEEAGDDHYARSLRLPHGVGTVRLTSNQGHVDAALKLGDVRDLSAAVSRVRRLLDLDADPVAVSEMLIADDMLAPVVTNTPGIRVPGSADGAETAIRAVLGQQVSVSAARTAASRLTEHLGEELPFHDGEVHRLFPTSEALAEADLFSGPRKQTLNVLARQLASEQIRIHPGREADKLRQELTSVDGIGAWTADYVIMRALGAPDVLLDTDLGVRKGAAALGINNLICHSKAWSPWRSYAGMYLWRAYRTLTKETDNPRNEGKER